MTPKYEARRAGELPEGEFDGWIDNELSGEWWAVRGPDGAGKLVVQAVFMLQEDAAAFTAMKNGADPEQG